MRVQVGANDVITVSSQSIVFRTVVARKHCTGRATWRLIAELAEAATLPQGGALLGLTKVKRITVGRVQLFVYAFNGEFCRVVNGDLNKRQNIQ